MAPDLAYATACRFGELPRRSPGRARAPSARPVRQFSRAAFPDWLPRGAHATSEKWCSSERALHRGAASTRCATAEGPIAMWPRGCSRHHHVVVSLPPWILHARIVGLYDLVQVVPQYDHPGQLHRVRVLSSQLCRSTTGISPLLAPRTQIPSWNRHLPVSRLSILELHKISRSPLCPDDPGGDRGR